MHILLSRTAQISSELHFCVELHTKKALRPGQKSIGDNKMMYCTSTYAVHEYQTSKTGVIIESHFGGLYDAYLFPFILSHPLLFSPPSLKPVLWP